MLLLPCKQFNYKVKEKFMRMNEVLNENPIIAAVKDFDSLQEALESNINIIFILFGDILSVSEISKKIRDKHKIGILHIDLVEGLSSKDVSIKFIKNNTYFNGIISTKANVIKSAKLHGLIAIQRFFIFDTISLNNSKSHIISECDAIEILPGVIPKVIKKIENCTNKPIVVGGLIDNKEDVISALSAGATSVSSSKNSIWKV